MRQDKDRSGKWLLTHHGDAVLRLGGITGFTAWKALQAETVAPRRLPDGLLEVRFPGQAEPTLVLVEIETYPDSDADRQVLDDLMLIAVDRNTVPEVVSLVLKPKGKLTVTGASERTSSSGRTRIGGAWPVVRLWELDAEALLASPDVGVIPWVPLARTALAPDELLTRCRDRLVQVADPNDRAGLIAVTHILADLAFPGRSFNLLGDSAMLDKVFATAVRESPALQEMLKGVMRRQGLREDTLAALEARFGSVPTECEAALDAVPDELRLKALFRLAVTCPDIDAFVAGLTPVP
jgi:hypothetical protein